MEHENEDLEDEFPFQKGDFQVPAVRFLGSTCWLKFPLSLFLGGKKQISRFLKMTGFSQPERVHTFFSRVSCELL